MDQARLQVGAIRRNVGCAFPLADMRQREGGPTAGDEFRVGGQVQDTTSRSGKAVALEAVTVAFNVADRGV